MPVSAVPLARTVRPQAYPAPPTTAGRDPRVSHLLSKMMDFYDVFGRRGAAHLSVLLLLTCMFCLPKSLVIPLDYLDYLMDWLLLLTFPVYF